MGGLVAPAVARRVVRRRGVTALMAAVLLFLLSGCWMQVGAGPGHTRFNTTESVLTAANVDSLHELWSVEVPGQLSEAVVSDGRVFVTRTTASTTNVRAVAATSGTTLWDVRLLAVPPNTGAVVGGAPVAFVGDDLWAGHYGYMPQAPGGPACVSATDILDPATGEVTNGPPAFPSAAVSSGPVVARAVVRLDPSCGTTPTPELEVQNRPPGGSGATWTASMAGLPVGTILPTLAGDQVLLTHEDTLYAFTAGGCGAASCEPRWTVAVESPSTPVAEATGPVFVGAGDELVAVDRAAGRELWRAPLAGRRAGLALADGTVYVTSLAESGSARALEAFDARGCGAPACDPMWTAPLDGPNAGDPVVGGGVVYVADGEAIVAFDATGCGAATCAPLTRVEGTGWGRLSLADGKVFLTTTDRLVALAPDPG